MSKKMFAFGGLAISLVIGLICMVGCFSSFTSVALEVAFESNPASAIAYGIGYLLTGLLLIAASLAGIVLLIIFNVKNKEPKFPIISIIVLACAALMFVSFNIMNIVSNATTISNLAKNLDNGIEKYKAYYAMGIVTSLVDIFTYLAVTLIVAVLGVLSLITFKKKKAEPAA